MPHFTMRRRRRPTPTFRPVAVLPRRRRRRLALLVAVAGRLLHLAVPAPARPLVVRPPRVVLRRRAVHRSTHVAEVRLAGLTRPVALPPVLPVVVDLVVEIVVHLANSNGGTVPEITTRYAARYLSHDATRTAILR